MFHKVVWQHNRRGVPDMLLFVYLFFKLFYLFMNTSHCEEELRTMHHIAYSQKQKSINLKQVLPSFVPFKPV